jgi:hypothetical protein
MPVIVFEAPKDPSEVLHTGVIVSSEYTETLNGYQIIQTTFKSETDPFYGNQFRKSFFLNTEANRNQLRRTLIRLGLVEPDGEVSLDTDVLCGMLENLTVAAKIRHQRNNYDFFEVDRYDPVPGGAEAEDELI